MIATSRADLFGRCLRPAYYSPAPRHHTRGAVQRGVDEAGRHRSAIRPLTARADPSASLPPVAEQPIPVLDSVPKARTYDFLVLGSGIAGLSYALKAATHGSVAVVTKEAAKEGSTQWAQGGVCAVLGEYDTPEAHIEDTIVAGDFLNDRKAVEVVCREGPAAVLELADLGANFTRNRDGSLHLTREGGHSARRIVHAEDVTGKEIERALLALAAADPNITMFEHHLAVDLVLDEDLDGHRMCVGADVLDQHAGRMTRFVAPSTFLATGGAGQVYPITTNPGVCTGDGMAMAARGGAALSGMEFVQFHPTGFYAPDRAPGARTFLISEALRGEGAHLLDHAGHRFMGEYDTRLELAPRDIVARAIWDQMSRNDDTHMLLDISHCQRDHVLTHFPNIAAACARSGIDITREPIPVSPAAHYICGGVKTGLHGETGIGGLFAAGEVASTGLHGANRLASNSLLEGLVFARRAVPASAQNTEAVKRDAGGKLLYSAAHADFPGLAMPAALSPGTRDWITSRRAKLHDVMWAAAGIVRRQADMKEGLQQLSQLAIETKAMASSYSVATELVELGNLAVVGTAILDAAVRRKESRGGHFCVDYPPKRSQHAPVTSRPPPVPLPAGEAEANKAPQMGAAMKLGPRPSAMKKQRQVITRSKAAE